MAHHYTLYIDEAGDPKVDRLKPEFPQGNSEWLCLGGYLIRAEAETDLERRRDSILAEVGGRPGNELHYKKLSLKNRKTAVERLTDRTFSARGFVICSYKHTMLNHSNVRAAKASANPKDVMYNFVCRLLLERATRYVRLSATRHGIDKPILRIVMASRTGHRFGHFKAYVQQLIYQATAGSTYLNTRAVDASVLSVSQIARIPASQSAGVQLADCMTSAFFQSLEKSSPTYDTGAARNLLPLMAERSTRLSASRNCANEGVTLYPATKAVHLISEEQASFFKHFGYDLDSLKRRLPTQNNQQASQEERIWGR